MPLQVLKSEYECPQCAKTTGQSLQIVAAGGELSCPNGHKWNDTMTFLDLKPRAVFKVVMPKAGPQENHGPLTLTVPLKLKKDLEDKYGEKLSSTASAILSQMSEGTAMILPASDVQRMADWLGKKPDNSSELVGLVYAKICAADDARAERDNAVKDLKAYEGLSPGRVVVDLDSQYLAAQAKAKDAELPLKLWAEQNLKTAIENNWF